MYQGRLFKGGGMRFWTLKLGYFGFSIFCCFVAQAGTAQSKETVGWQEKVKIYPGNIVIQGKLDTGADFSSLNAANIEQFEKDNRKWARFEIANRYGNKITIEKPVLREALVKRHSGKPQKRMVIRLGICVGQHYMEADVNLVDRSQFETQMLIGRSYLAGNLIIDPSMTFTSEPNCKVGGKPGSKS